MHSKVLVRLEIFKTILQTVRSVDQSISISKDVEKYLYSDDIIDKGAAPPKKSRTNKQIPDTDKGEKPPVASTKDAVLQDT